MNKIGLRKVMDSGRIAICKSIYSHKALRKYADKMVLVKWDSDSPKGNGPYGSKGTYYVYMVEILNCPTYCLNKKNFICKISKDHRN